VWRPSRSACSRTRMATSRRSAEDDNAGWVRVFIEAGRGLPGAAVPSRARGCDPERHPPSTSGSDAAEPGRGSEAGRKSSPVGGFLRAQVVVQPPRGHPPEGKTRRRRPRSCLGASQTSSTMATVTTAALEKCVVAPLTDSIECARGAIDDVSRANAEDSNGTASTVPRNGRIAAVQPGRSTVARVGCPGGIARTDGIVPGGPGITLLPSRSPGRRW
jgi:hypothetical protein